jgi:hypothetical protein
MSCKASPSELIDIWQAYVPTQSSYPTLRWRLLVHTKSEEKNDRTRVTTAITLNLRTKRLLPLTKYLPKHVAKGSTRGRAHRAYRGLLIAVPTVIGAWGETSATIAKVRRATTLTTTMTMATARQATKSTMIATARHLLCVNYTIFLHPDV